MSIGTAIFFSGIFLSFVGLYAATKDRWRWRIFAQRVSLMLGGILLLVMLAGTSFYVWQYIPWPISQQTEYARVKIGASPDEMNYVRGSPTNVLGEMSKDPDTAGWQKIIEIKDIEKGKTIRDYNEWS
jgi:hypothetical protein